MIYLLFGPDKYRLARRVTEIKKAAGIQEEDANFLEFMGNYDSGRIFSEVNAMPFLSEKRVVLISGLLATKDKVLADNVSKWLPNCPAETELIFVEDESPDQRLSITKLLTTLAKVESFSLLTPIEIIRSIEKDVKDRGGEITKDAANRLQLYAGSDLTRISNEIDKLICYSNNITKDNVDLLVDAGYFNTIFDLTDAISAKNQKKAMDLLERALESGENESYLLSMMAMQVRNLLLVLDLRSHQLSEQEIASRAKIHPYVVKKSISVVKNFDMETLIAMHREILSIEEAIKTTANDPRALLSSFIIKATSK